MKPSGSFSGLSKGYLVKQAQLAWASRELHTIQREDRAGKSLPSGPVGRGQISSDSTVDNIFNMKSKF